MGKFASHRLQFRSLCHGLVGVVVVFCVATRVVATEARMDPPTVRATGATQSGTTTTGTTQIAATAVRSTTDGTMSERRAPLGFPDADTASSGTLRIGQSYEEVRAWLLAQSPPARLQVTRRRSAPGTTADVVMLRALLSVPSQGYIEQLRLRFTSAQSGHALYFIHRDVAFTRATQENLNLFARQVAARFQRNTWSLNAPRMQSYRQVYYDGRLLSGWESQLRPMLGGCFLLTGGPSMEDRLDSDDFSAASDADTAQCGGGVDADWRGDINRFTLTMIDFPLLMEDRQTLRGGVAQPASVPLPALDTASPVRSTPTPP